MVEHCPHFRFKDTTKNPICKRFFAKTYQKPDTVPKSVFER